MLFDKNKPYNNLPDLPPTIDIETKKVLKLTTQARASIAKVDGLSYNIPNQPLILKLLTVKEAQVSSQIENIVTTTDNLYQELSDETPANINQHEKEVLRYHQAINIGFEYVEKNEVLSTSLFCKLATTIKKVEMPIRKLPGTIIKDTYNDIVVYTPPEGETLLREKLANLEEFIHNNQDLDPLIKLALMHYQFEAIHPFSDTNGRVGRILNILFLIQTKLLSSPIIYFSKYILDNKNSYYSCLKAVTEDGNWEEWIVFMLQGLDQSAKITLELINDVRNTMDHVSNLVKERLPRIYSKELVEILFKYPYCKIDFLKEIAGRETVSKYLHSLVEAEILTEIKKGRTIYFINNFLLNLIR